MTFVGNTRDLAHLEKKWTRLRLYTKYLDETCIQRMEMASRITSDDVTIYKTYDEYKDELIYQWNKGIPWVDEKLRSENGEPTDNIDHVCKPFRFKCGHAEWPTYNWKEDGYCNIGDLPGMIRVGNSIHYQDYEWYDALEDSDLNDEALNNKAILEESINVEEESSLFTKPEITIAQSLLRTINDNGAQKNDEWFDNHEPIEDDDDDIEDLEDYLIQKDPPYYVNEDTKRSKERRCKLHRIPYVEPPTCKSEKFEELTEQDDEIDGVLIF
ncbi:hypothetical protein Tco_0581949 [Tanacetum coccineum]